MWWRGCPRRMQICVCRLRMSASGVVSGPLWTSQLQLQYSREYNMFVPMYASMNRATRVIGILSS